MTEPEKLVFVCGPDWLPSYDKLLDALIDALAAVQAADPREIGDRIDASYISLNTLTARDHHALLTVALDRLVMENIR